MRTVKSLVVLLLSVVLCLLGLEAAVRAFIPVRHVGPTATTYSEELGFENKKSLRAVQRSPEYTIRVETNRFGLRGPETTLEKPPGVRRVLFLGDSFTFGMGVEYEQTFSRLVQEMLENRGLGEIEALNSGVISWGGVNELLFLEKRGLKFQPDLIVWQVCHNDFDDNEQSSLLALGENEEIRPGSPDRRLKLITSVFDALPFKEILESSYLFNHLRVMLNITIRQGGKAALSNAERERNANGASPYRFTELLTERLLRTAGEQDVPVIGLWFDLSELQRAALKPAFERHSTPIIDLGELKEQRPDLYYAIDGHWRAEGHRWAALHIADAVAEFFAGRPDGSRHASARLDIAEASRR